MKKSVLLLFLLSALVWSCSSEDMSDSLTNPDDIVNEDNDNGSGDDGSGGNDGSGDGNGDGSGGNDGSGDGNGDGSGGNDGSGDGNGDGSGGNDDDTSLDCGPEGTITENDLLGTWALESLEPDVGLNSLVSAANEANCQALTYTFQNNNTIDVEDRFLPFFLTIIDENPEDLDLPLEELMEVVITNLAETCPDPQPLVFDQWSVISGNQLSYVDNNGETFNACIQLENNKTTLRIFGGIANSPFVGEGIDNAEVVFTKI